MEVFQTMPQDFSHNRKVFRVFAEAMSLYSKENSGRTTRVLELFIDHHTYQIRIQGYC
jgi:hypothetical protein